MSDGGNFETGGREPDAREDLIIFMMLGQRDGKQTSTSVVGIGCREQEDDLALVTNLDMREAST